MCLKLIEKRFYARLLKKEKQYLNEIDELKNTYKDYPLEKLKDISIYLEESTIRRKEDNIFHVVVTIYVALLTLLISPLLSLFVSMPIVAVNLFKPIIEPRLSQAINAEQTGEMINRAADLVSELYKIVIEALSRLYGLILIAFIVLALITLVASSIRSREIAYYTRLNLIIKQIIAEKEEPLKR